MMLDSLQVYGILHCDTVKKARAFLAACGCSYTFHNFKQQGIADALLQDWLAQVGWQRLLKKTGPSWTRLSAEIKASMTDNASALPIMLAQPNLIRRPVITRHGKIIAMGFHPAEYQSLFKPSSP